MTKSSPKKLLRSFIVGLITVALIAWFLNGVDLRALGRRILEADLGYLFLGFLLAQLHYVLRAWRWKYLLLPVGKSPFSDRFNAVAVGYATNNLMPARAGEVARPYVLARRVGLPFPATLATVLLERLLDMMTVAFLFVVATPFVMASNSSLSGVPVAKPALLLVALLLLVVVGWLLVRFAGNPLKKTGGWLLRLLPGKVQNILQESFGAFLTGFSALGRGRVLLFVIAASLILWIEVSFAIWATARAFGVFLSVPGSIFVTGWLAVGMAAPTPAGVGGYHAACRYALTVFFAVEAALAAGIALVMHALAVIPVTIWGLIIISKEGLDLGSIAQPPPEEGNAEAGEQEPEMKTGEQDPKPAGTPPPNQVP